MITGMHHIAIICSDIQQSIDFYTRVFGFNVIRKTYREERNSWKVDLNHTAQIQLELFTFADAPPRPSYPEAIGLRHIAFQVDNLEKICAHILQLGLQTETIRTDAFTGKRFTFLADPDGLPIELYEK